MLLLTAAAVLAADPQPSTSRLQPKSSICPRTKSYVAGAESVYRGKPLTPRSLTELPDANLYLTAYRLIDGCEAPIVVKYGVSGR